MALFFRVLRQLLVLAERLGVLARQLADEVVLPVLQLVARQLGLALVGTKAQ